MSEEPRQKTEQELRAVFLGDIAEVEKIHGGRDICLVFHREFDGGMVHFIYDLSQSKTEPIYVGKGDASSLGAVFTLMPGFAVSIALEKTTDLIARINRP